MDKDWLGLFEPALSRMSADLEALVSMESPSEDAGRVSLLAGWIRDRLRERGVGAELRPCPPRGEALLASVGPRDGRTLLLGHLDTVWPVGSLLTSPYRVQGERAQGPGVFDMKAGIVVAMAALAALGRERHPPAVSLLLVPDEEVGTLASRDLLLSVARRHRQVLVLEPSQEGAVKIARKGTGLFRVSLTGRSAHAGLDPEKGASALAELARFVLFLETLGDAAQGTSVTPTVAQAGSVTNVVPERATVSVDVRVWSKEEARRVETAIREHRSADPRVFIAAEGGFDRPPMEPTPASQALYARAKSIALGLRFELGAARVGGASDGNLTAAAGLPTLDGLGPAGGGAHARNEYVIVPDLPRRAALLAGLAVELD
ncbi:MAG TPA: M20 family metallopeptidase [Vicinamibacteria bacterium]|nr:M20 family metallopeptidase [Vicinamibacteria bacterium]